MVTYPWDGAIAHQVGPDGNIPRSATNASWVDKDGLPNQGDGRYTGYTGSFTLMIGYYTAPGVPVTQAVMSVSFTNGVVTGTSPGASMAGTQRNTGRNAGQKLKRTNPRWLASLWGAVQLSTGAEATDRPLFSFHGARDWRFGISYNSALASAQTTQGALGFGWSHPFETRIRTAGTNLVLEWDKTRENTFTPKTGSAGTFISTEDTTRFDVIIEQAGGGWLLTRRDQSSRLFDASGRLTEDRDAHGRKLVLAYDGGGRLSTITEPVSNTQLTFAFVSGANRVATITDGTNASVVFAYSATPMLSGVVNQNGKQTTFAYNTNREFLTLSDHNGAVLTSNTVDGQGRVTAQDDGVAGNQPVGITYEERALPGNNLYAASDTQQTVPLVLPVPGEYRVASYTGLNGQTVGYNFASDGRLNTAVVNGQTTTVNYDTQGNVASTTDSNGQTAAVAPRIVTKGTDRVGKQSTYEFDPDFRLRSMKNPLGQTTSYAYDAQGNMTSTTDPLNRTTSFTYDLSGNVLTSTDAANKVTTYTYDARNNLLTVTDPNNKTTSYTYDTANNVLTMTDALGRITSWTYNANSQPLTMTLPGTGVYQYAYTAGRLTQVTDPNGVITKFGYDANGRVLYTEDSAGKRITNAYDALGNLLTVTNALNQVTTYTYDHRNRVLTVTDPLGAATSHTYDHNHNLLTLTDPLNKVTTFTYDGEDRPKTVKDATNRMTTTVYDDAGRRVGISDPASQTTSFEYNAAGELTAVQNPLGHRTTTTRDNRGLPLTVTDPLSRVVTFTYDDLGRQVTAKDPLNRTTSFVYDALHRVTSVTDPGSLTASQGFDVDGNRTSLTNPATHATAFAFDAGGRLTSSTTPEGRATGATYNARGLPATATEPSTQSASFTYDDAARLSSMTDAVGTIALTRDNAGRVITVTEGTKTLAREYDLAGRLTKFTNSDGNVLLYAYDDAGRLTKLTYPDLKEVAYAYDTAGRLQTVTDWASRVTTYNYDNAGRLTQTTRPNGTKQTRSYDNAGQLTQLREFAPDETTVLYAADAITYDLAGRLTGETLTPGVAPTAFSATQTFDRDNRLLTHNGAATTFDADGNLLAIASGIAPASYTYDARNRLTAAGGITYTYDAEDRRIALTDASGTTRFAINPLASPDQVLARTAPNGTKTFYVHGLGLLHEENGSTVRYYHHDRRGDTVALTDASGVVTDRVAYGVYGEIVSRTGTTNTPFLFNGRWGVQTDASGIYHHRARYYHPALRRFLNQDTVLGAISDAAGMNRFVYANGNPVSLIDPYGLAAKDIAGGTWSGSSMAFVSAATSVKDTLIGTIPGAKLALTLAPESFPARLSRAMDEEAESMKEAIDDTVADMTGADNKTSYVYALNRVGAEVGTGFLIGGVRGFGAAGEIAAVESGLAKGVTEIVHRAMSRAELAATQSSHLLRGGRSGTHYVSDAVNSTAGRARQRLALPQTPEVRVTLEVPANTFSPATRVQPRFNMPGGGMERSATGNVPVRIIRVEDL